MNNELKLNDRVIYSEAYDGEVFTITGITLDSYQLTGDWSGGTQCINQPSWISRNKKLIKVED